MERIAVISDIHGNLEALNTVLKDIEEKNIKKIFCLGDIVGKGIHPKECIDLVLDKCEIIVQGNLEAFVCSEDLESERKEFYKKQLGEEYLNKIRNLSFCHELYISGSLVRMFHASPKSVYTRLNYFSDHREKISAFFSSDKTITQKNADIVIFGDLHRQFIEKFYNKTLINCGSVGNATEIIRDESIDSSCMETTQAFYLIIEGEIDSKEYNNSLSFNFVRIPYNIEKELNSELEILEKEKYEDELKKGIYRNADKIKEKYNI